MEEKDYLDLLSKREIQPTAIRILVLQAMLKAGRSVSLLDLEKILDTVDKSSIFRTITDRKSTRLNSSHTQKSRMPSSA